MAPRIPAAARIAATVIAATFLCGRNTRRARRRAPGSDHCAARSAGGGCAPAGSSWVPARRLVSLTFSSCPATQEPGDLDVNVPHFKAGQASDSLNHMAAYLAGQGADRGGIVDRQA